jgi:hypothetical protein
MKMTKKNTIRDEDLALWFTPQALRDHFDGDDSEVAEAVLNADDDTLREQGQDALSSDILYSVFHEECKIIGQAILDEKENR